MNDLGTRTIETERLTLRKLNKKDAKYIFNNWANDDRVTKTLTFATHENIDTTKSVLKTWIEDYGKKHTYRWGIQFKNSEELIGMIDVVKNTLKDERCEIGYLLMYKHWNKGIMTEALEAVLKYLLNEVGYYMVELCHSSANPASGAVMKKCGMIKDGELPDRIKNADGTRSDLIYYSITKK